MRLLRGCCEVAVRLSGGFTSVAWFVGCFVSFSALLDIACGYLNIKIWTN